jgi:hypothetical protein
MESCATPIKISSKKSYLKKNQPKFNIMPEEATLPDSFQKYHGITPAF